MKTKITNENGEIKTDLWLLGQDETYIANEGDVVISSEDHSVKDVLRYLLGEGLNKDELKQLIEQC
jgi:hydrogenase maturation factor